VKSNYRPFQPSSLFSGPIAQTILGSQFTGDTRVGHRSMHKIAFAPNTTLVVLEWRPPKPDSPLVLMGHGMGGCSESAYMRRIARKLAGEGFGIFMMNHRGSGPGMGMCDRLFNGGSSDDLAGVVDYIQTLYPNNPLSIIGFSLSGNILLKYLGEGRALPANLKGALAVNPPIDLAVASRKISEGPWARTFNNYYLKLMYHQMDAMRDCFPEAFYPAERASTIWDFDVRYTAPAAGYDGVEDYYGRCSSGQFLGGISVPTSILCSLDDPFIPAKVFGGTSPSDNVRVLSPKRGGHMGYLSRTKTPLGDFRWMDYFCVEWARSQRDGQSSSEMKETACRD